jgi:ADP-ribose pyrophosphatase YjhB (NUDIX family)
VSAIEKAAIHGKLESFQGSGIRRQYGAIAWRRSRSRELKILLITSRERGRWIVPKGWPIKGETPAKVAALEAFEEGGVFGDVRSEPIGAYDYLKILRDGSTALCRVVLFGIEVRGTLANWPEQSQRKRSWFTVSEAGRTVSDYQLAQVLKSLEASCTVCVGDCKCGRLPWPTRPAKNKTVSVNQNLEPFPVTSLT